MTAAHRTPRREVRLGCWLEWKGERQLAHTSDLSRGGMSLQLPRGSRGPPPDARVSFRLLVGAEPLEGLGRVVWVDGDDRDVQDRVVAGFGVEFLQLEPVAEARLASFLEEFRHSLIVLDDDPDYPELYRALGEDYRLHHCETTEQALRVLETEEVSAILAAERLSNGDALSFFKSVTERLPNATAARLLISEYTIAGQLQLLVNFGRLFSYIRKPFGARELHQTVRRAIEAYVLSTENRVLLSELERANERLRRENTYLRQRYSGVKGFEAVVGHSAELRRTLDELSRVQRTDTTVHLAGETGTGKELFARALHTGGRRTAGPFVAQSCAGISEGLIQSTLFGYLRGAFTGADRDHPGIFQRADGGTLFLDEVSELSAEAQSALLRVLQQGEVLPLGSGRPVPVDVRVISASNQDLRQRVAEGRFREDLFFRLMVLPIHIPPLRIRQGDVAVLAVHFLDRHCERRGKNLRGFTVEAMRALEEHPWPGNVRELENEIERVVLLAEDQQKFHLDHLSEHLRPGSSPTPSPAPGAPGGLCIPRGLGFDAAVERLERELITQALERSGGNITRAAGELQMERSRLTKLKERLGLGTPGPRR